MTLISIFIRNENRDNIFHVIDSFKLPKYNYSNEKKKFLKYVLFYFALYSLGFEMSQYIQSR